MFQLILVAIGEYTQRSHLVKYSLMLAMYIRQNMWNNFYVFILIYASAISWNKSIYTLPIAWKMYTIKYTKTTFHLEIFQCQNYFQATEVRYKDRIEEE
jgi:hypothetical protein